MRYLTAITAILLLAGCASTGLSEQGERAYFKAQRQAASEPIMSMRPLSGRVIDSPDNDSTNTGSW